MLGSKPCVMAQVVICVVAVSRGKCFARCVSCTLIEAQRNLLKCWHSRSSTSLSAVHSCDLFVMTGHSHVHMAYTRETVVLLSSYRDIGRLLNVLTNVRYRAALRLSCQRDRRPHRPPSSLALALLSPRCISPLVRSDAPARPQPGLAIHSMRLC